MIAAKTMQAPAKPQSVNDTHVHLCNGLVPRRDGGMVPSILGFAGALARRGGRSTILTPTPSDRSALNLPPGVELLGPEPEIESRIRDSGIVHIHGLWQGHGRRGAALARRHRVPYLIAAHGMAEPWAMRHKALKKRIYTALVEGKNLRRATCLHALSRPEIGHLRALAPKTPIALVPNGVDLAPFDALPSRSLFEAEHPEILGKFVLLFYGRLHVKKGLDLLAGAVATLAKDHPELHVVLAGTDDGAKAPLVSQAEALGIADRLTFLGHLSGDSARRAWGAADAFVLPSYSEGFSMAILEALAARQPVVVTTACHFPDLERADAGIVTEPTLAGVISGLRQLLNRGVEGRRELASRGRLLVESRYTWDEQARRLAEVYDWMAGGGTPPEAVVEPGWS